ATARLSPRARAPAGTLSPDQSQYPAPHLHAALLQGSKQAVLTRRDARRLIRVDGEGSATAAGVLAIVVERKRCGRQVYS
ncbi:hypothetical protein Q6284_33925, partial [Klebsiella pneumoniae]